MTNNYTDSSPNFSIESLLKKDKDYEARVRPLNRTDEVPLEYCTTFVSTIHPPSLYFPMVSNGVSIHQARLEKTTVKNTRSSAMENMPKDTTMSSSKKRTRTAFTNHQIKELESEFKSNRYLTISRRSELAKSLQLTDNQIKIWFQNRRTKLKRQIAADIALTMARPGHLIPSHPTTPSYCTQCLPAAVHTTLQGCWHHSTSHPPYMLDHPLHSFQYGSLEKIVN